MWPCFVFIIAHIGEQVSVTNRSCALIRGATPIWSSNNSQYALLRKEFNLSTSSKVASACIAITAQQSDDRLLASYKLWFNGVPISNGPGRNMNATQGFDVVRFLPSFLNTTSHHTIAIQAYHRAGKDGTPGPNGKVMVKFAATFADGASQVIVSDATWSGLGVNDAFNPYHGCLGGMYCAPKEYLDARAYPAGWRLSGGGMEEAWPAAVARTPFDLKMPLAMKEALPVVQYTTPAAKITELTSTQCLVAPANTHDWAVLSCNGTDVIKTVLFASFGHPGGICTGPQSSTGAFLGLPSANISSSTPNNTFGVTADCDALHAKEALESLCLGENYCQLNAHDFTRIFNGSMPCLDAHPHLWLAAAVECGANSDASSSSPGIPLRRYLVDVGREIQGGVALAMASGVEGAQINMRLSETLLTNGSARQHMSTGNDYEEFWTMRAGTQVQYTQKTINGHVARWQFVYCACCLSDSTLATTIYS